MYIFGPWETDQNGQENQSQRIIYCKLQHLEYGLKYEQLKNIYSEFLKLIILTLNFSIIL